MLSKPPAVLPEYLNCLEPPGLIEHFLRHPPEGFAIVLSPAGQPGFRMSFDLLTTMDGHTLRRLMRLPMAGSIRRALTWPTLFWGTTVTEYLPLSPHRDGMQFVDTLLSTWGGSSRLMILKDIPDRSPLLSEPECLAARHVLEACKQAGCILVAGQALAYVTIDFSGETGYLARLSYSRRKHIRRKLRRRPELHIEMLRTGCERLRCPALLAELYALYLNVYQQSDIHFDKLTAEFFSAVFQDASLDGHLVLYSSPEGLIGFNLCFVYQGMLIDKYVGFRYPEARDYNLYVISWMENLAFAQSRKLTHYVAGWTDPEIKADLGASFTFTHHAVYVRNPLLRRIVGRLSKVFEHDKTWFEEQQS